MNDLKFALIKIFLNFAVQLKITYLNRMHSYVSDGTS